MCFGSIVVPASRHFRHAGELVRHAFNVAYQTGDFTYAAYSLTQVVMNLLVVGDPLSQAQTEAEKGVEFAKKARVGLAADIIASDLQLIRTLRGLTREFGSFDDQQFNEAEFERHLASNPAFAEAGFGYWTLKTEARFFAGDYSSAIDASRKAHQKPWVTILEPASLVYYGALSHAALDCSLPDQQKDQIETLKASHRQLEVWAKHCPENFEDRAALVGAEIARIDGRVVEAEELYEKGIRSAHANGFIHNEAVAFEVAARFYAARGLDKIADSYLREARYCYLRWGADGKVKQLDEKYPQLVQRAELPGSKRTIMEPVELLDLTTVISVSQAISGEINLEKLIDTVMRLAVQHAGAERGLLVLHCGNEYQIGAESTTNLGVPKVYLRGGRVEDESLPGSILNYVVRTKKSLILDDASTPNEFSGDAYFIRHRARSLLCLPLLNQAEIIGVLYLENKLTPRVFDGARVAALQVIASQAAISLTNSYLYRDQKQAETALRRSEAFLAEAQTLSHTGSCGWNVSNGELVWSEETYRIVGIAPATKPTLDLVWQIVHPEDRDIVRRSIDDAARSSADINSEHRIVMSDGSIKDVHLVMRAVKNQHGNLEYIGALTDVTATKNAFRQIEGLKDQLQRENVALREEVDAASMFEEIVGTSPALRAVLSRVSKVAPTDSTVLITGETGTGKELIARAIHKRSARSARAFVSVSCAAVPSSLIASELFGHEKGAFTGALQRRLGRFELAEGGTIFFDEIGELSAEAQNALLRVLQEREFERVGGSRPISTDVRVIAATNRNLRAAIAAGTFRLDLFYRLSVFPIELPPLRERKEDIPMLLEYFTKRYASRLGKNIKHVDKRTLELFQSYDWP